MLALPGAGDVLAGALLALAGFGAGFFAASRRRTGEGPASPRADRLASAGVATAIVETAAASAPPNADRAAAPAAPQAQPAPGERTLGRYRLIREIGRGSMGAVYLGHDPQLDRPVAIKTMALSREFADGDLDEARVRFFREAEVARRLRHPDIVTVHDAGEDQGLAFIAMEFVAGHDLLRYTGLDALLPVPSVLRTMARVASALSHAHAQGIVHRDVKPANVMVDPEHGVVKVTDFGIARITDASRTRTGMVMGTPSFMSPEQLTGQLVDGRTDLYSLGVMLYQLLTGVLPHRSESMGTLMHQIVNEVPADIRTLRPGLPEALANLVALAIEKRPELRYGDGEQLAADLLAVAQRVESRPPVAAPPAGPALASDSTAFEATAKISPLEPRHNADH